MQMRRREVEDQTERRLTAARHYTARGWRLFSVSESKRPWHNCGDCGPGSCTADAGLCTCLWCHGHLAATEDMGRLEDMVRGRPAGLLALACGAASGVVVVDAEGTDRQGVGRTGLESLDELEWWGDTLKAGTSGGGVHLYYRHPGGEHTVSSRNRVLGNVDIKGDGGYVVLPPAPGRSWLNWTPRDGSPSAPSADLLEWLLTAKGGGSAGGGVGGKRIVIEPGAMVPAGMRYEHLRGLVYKLRIRGVDRASAEQICRAWHARYEQPPVAEYALPWRQVEYELERAWARVTPEAGPSQGQQRWAQKMAAGRTGGKASGSEGQEQT
jgi:hypothetical protein